jgi:hypothetical protein
MRELHRSFWIDEICIPGGGCCGQWCGYGGAEDYLQGQFKNARSVERIVVEERSESRRGAEKRLDERHG